MGACAGGKGVGPKHEGAEGVRRREDYKGSGLLLTEKFYEREGRWSLGGWGWVVGGWGGGGVFFGGGGVWLGFGCVLGLLGFGLFVGGGVRRGKVKRVTSSS